ncbi:dTDP-4-dehydrorhamnose 3,5-epimerase family protein [Streptomyces laculatispora]|uniref:dTDP-4-dehydrorhamnose 3,5-epimerase family protein n=1 Tax=Streptomyces laculatispora TaxID=887464 RepID=A0ABY9I0J8_9ACTN|nr:dTDP-4-dehydrorhamnose 3,5-epimerase family protein [Streptomyces laculatispora]MBO0913741.1 dTDP-4-dehydrorhamnose 3,5-epimerase family protein [Streptomyces laculatispora]WLQ40114.1 dTDP-4-dehydrorhamnose 3,5-epimerase family protein [Streptomyces laculatispora]
MQATEAKVPGVHVLTPRQIRDERGAFFESLRTDLIEDIVGQPFEVKQINYSVSHRNTLRGIHSVTIPPGQAKYVSCVRGAFRDFVVDLRVGSPTFGENDSNILDADSGRAVYIPEGVGHGFLTLTDDTCICYVLSSTYVPGTQIDIDPLDSDLALPWGFSELPLISKKDRRARSLAATLKAGLLSEWTDGG